MDPMESIEVQGSIVRKTTYTRILTILFAFVGIAKVLNLEKAVKWVNE